MSNHTTTPDHPLTPRQIDTYRIIAAFKRENGYAPSYDQIRIALGCSSKHVAFLHVSGLERRGYIRRDKGHARSIELLKALDGRPLMRCFKAIYYEDPYWSGLNATRLVEVGK